MSTGTFLENNESFKVKDAHRLLKGSWTGTTEFVELPDYLEETVLRGGVS